MRNPKHRRLLLISLNSFTRDYYIVRIKYLILLGIFMCHGVTFSPAMAQPAYPTKPIRLIVPFAPGGGTDIVARTLAQKLTESFKQTVVVDNRAGGGGALGTETAVRANADGYTMILVSASYGSNAALLPLPFDPVKDVIAVSVVGESCFILGVYPAVPAKTVKELAAYAKANPGKLNYGSTGTGGVTHMASELFDLVAGVKTTHIPYKGTGPALTDLIAGQIQMQFAPVPAILPHVKSGRVRGLGVTLAKRHSLLPDMPAVGESIAGYEAPVWYGVMGPKQLPRAIIDAWGEHISKAVQTQDMKDRMTAEGIDRADTSSKYFADTINRDVAKWKRVVREANIKVVQ